MDEASHAVQNGDVTAYILFHKNFTVKTGRIRENLPITDRDVDEIQINIIMDKSSKSSNKLWGNGRLFFPAFSDYPIARYVEKALLERYDNFSQELETSCGYKAKTASLPINKQPAVYSSYDAKFSEFMAPGFLLT